MLFTVGIYASTFVINKLNLNPGGKCERTSRLKALDPTTDDELIVSRHIVHVEFPGSDERIRLRLIRKKARGQRQAARAVSAPGAKPPFNTILFCAIFGMRSASLLER